MIVSRVIRTVELQRRTKDLPLAVVRDVKRREKDDGRRNVDVDGMWVADADGRWTMAMAASDQ